MTPAVQQSSTFPVTLHEWERVLTKALLRADDGNADPIRSFEITPERLSHFCGQGPDRATDAEDAFRRALLSDGYLTWCLQNGRFRTPGNEAPECMAMLALSLLVDSLLDGDYGGTGEYRAKLRQWLGVDRSFMMLRGIATMWKELVAWLDARVADGAPFRRLILPEIPTTWTHIGYTRYLSFPTKRDLRFLERQVRRNLAVASDPAGLVRLLDPQVGSAAISFGLKKAFAEFRAALRSGRASFDHRFWKLVEQAGSVAGAPTASPVELRMEFDEDGRRHYRLSGEATPDVMPVDLGLAAASPLLLASPNLGPAARRGVMFFQSSGLASWTAAGEPPAGSGPFHVAVAPRHETLARGAIAQFGSSGAWIVTKTAVSSSTINDILARLGIRNARENLRTIGLVDGVHVGTSWLGTPRLLPRLDGTNGDVDVQRTDGGDGAIPKVSGGALSAGEPVEGQFLFSDPVGGWSRRASFVSSAIVHPDLSGAAYALTGAQIRTFTSRNAAIVDAHRQAGSALFRMDDHGVHRARVEGALPIEIARALRLRVLANGGMDEAGFRVANGKVRDERRRLLETTNVFATSSFVEPVLRYAAHELRIEQMVGKPDGPLGLLPKGSQVAFAELALSGLFEGDDADGEVRRAGRYAPYKHQVEMLERGIQAGKPGIVTSGTGSGKTESFMLPILAAISNEAVGWSKPSAGYLQNPWWTGQRDKWRLQRAGENRPAALRALVLYPMNALVEDQMVRLRRTLDSDEARAVMDARFDGNRIFFGQYTSSTQVTGYENHPRLWGHEPEKKRRTRRQRQLRNAMKKAQADQVAARDHDAEELAKAKQLGISPPDKTRFIFPIDDPVPDACLGGTKIDAWEMVPLSDEVVVARHTADLENALHAGHGGGIIS